MATLLTPSSLNYPSKLRYLQQCPFPFVFLLLLLSATSFAARPVAASGISYSDYCSHLVPESSSIDTSSSSSPRDSSLQFTVGVFSGGDDSLSHRNLTFSDLPKSVSFFPISFLRTHDDDGKVYKVEAILELYLPTIVVDSSPRPFSDRNQWLSRVGEPANRASYRLGSRFDLFGFWSESTGRLCLVGSGHFEFAAGDRRSYDAVLKLNYSTDSNIYGSLVHGVLESVKEKNNNPQSYFAPISILGVRNNPQNYEYKLLGQGKSECGSNLQESLSLGRDVRSLCTVFPSTAMPQFFGLRYRTGCDDSNRSCSAFDSSGGVEYLPKFMSLHTKLCDGEKMHMLLSFLNLLISGSSFIFDPTMALIAEGAWDAEKNRFCGVACRILNSSVVDDCSLRLSFSFPAVLSLRSMAPVVGELWSVKPETDPGYFSRIQLSSLWTPLRYFQGLRFEYTESERVEKLCSGRKKVSPKDKGKKHYPDPRTLDMTFHMLMKTRGDTQILSGKATPLFVGHHLYRKLLVLGTAGARTADHAKLNIDISSFTNISYRIQFDPVSYSLGSSVARVIHAEGMYDRNTGELCMVGCESLSLKNRAAQVNESLDCSITINIEFSPIESKSAYHLKGTIESTREKNDPLYFPRIELSSRSIYANTAEESVWRMDLEITMVLISNTLSCVFLGLQLYHMKKHPQLQSFISLAMLILLTLGHMIPLILNFEAMFKSNHNPQNTFFGNDGWLEAKEIVVRMVTMVAFLLEFRVLQLAWTARTTEEHSEGVWNAERRVFFISLPLYITGGLIAWLLNRSRRPQPTIIFRRPHPRHLLYRPYNLKRSLQRPPLWKDLRSYGGLMLDGFLLPQILFYVFCNSNVEALAASFYVGTSVVRLLPHAYDLYRSHSYGSSLDWSFIYADHKMDYYSTAWDIIIPCVGFLFALLIFLQQRFSGRCFLPKRFQENAGYEKVSEMGSVELHHQASDQHSSSNGF